MKKVVADLALDIYMFTEMVSIKWGALPKNRNVYKGICQLSEVYARFDYRTSHSKLKGDGCRMGWKMGPGVVFIPCGAKSNEATSFGVFGDYSESSGMPLAA